MALGGNALAPPRAEFDHEAQRARAAVSAEVVARIARTHRTVITHGNGPQVGYLAAQQNLPLDAIDAETAGLIGFALEEALSTAAPTLEVVSLLTRTLVDRGDPAFAAPTKPIGRFYTEAEATMIGARRNWDMRSLSGGWRRVVASPRPLAVIETRLIALLVEAGATVICDGGGGIPVWNDGGALRGIEAVVDKDASSAVLALALDADALLLLTDVDAVYEGFGTERARPIRRASPAALRSYRFEAGSMGPKVEAACLFADGSRGVAAIGALNDGVGVLLGERGTTISAVVPGMDFGP